MEHEAKNKSKSRNVMWNENQNRIKSKEWNGIGNKNKISNTMRVKNKIKKK